MYETIFHIRAIGGRLAAGVLLALLAGILTVAPASGSSTSAQQAERVEVGDQAIDFTMQSIDGETYRLSDLRGERNAILIFFRGTW